MNTILSTDRWKIYSCVSKMMWENDDDDDDDDDDEAKMIK
jgi:hypothetical protein